MGVEDLGVASDRWSHIGVAAYDVLPTPWLAAARLSSVLFRESVVVGVADAMRLELLWGTAIAGENNKWYLSASRISDEHFFSSVVFTVAGAAEDFLLQDSQV